MSTPQYTIRFTVRAQRMLRELSDRRVHRLLVERIERLASEPDKQGKPLTDELTGFRSVRAVGQRYRIIYRVLEREVMVVIVLVGRRRQGGKDDIYQLAKRLIKQGLLDVPG